MQSQAVEEPIDIELLRRAQTGDFRSFQQLVANLQPKVYGLTYRILKQHEDAEDATQQTFMALIEHINDFREESSVKTWVLRIAANFALKILRKKRSVKAVSMTDLSNPDRYADIPHPEFIAPWTKTAAEIVEQAELIAELEKALLELDDKYRLVFILRDIEGLSIRETAAALEITEATVKVRLLRARLALRESLTIKFGDPTQKMTPDHKHS